MIVRVETTIQATLQEVWKAWTNPEDIMQWNAASEDWVCPNATMDLREGGTFCFRMEAKNGAIGFDLTGTLTQVEAPHSLAYVMEDERTFQVQFTETEAGIRVLESFEAEEENSAEEQRRGWQAILDNFKRYMETSQLHTP